MPCQVSRYPTGARTSAGNTATDQCLAGGPPRRPRTRIEITAPTTHPAVTRAAISQPMVKMVAAKPIRRLSSSKSAFGLTAAASIRHPVPAAAANAATSSQPRARPDAGAMG